MRISGSLILAVFSRIFFIEFFAFVLCLFVAIIYQESLYPFVFSGLIVLALGVLSWIITKKKNIGNINTREGYLIVTGSWLMISLFGSLPFMFSGYFTSFIDAFFESVSGFTTTGSSILTDIEALPKSILFWRSLTHWIGGIGIIVLVIVVIPSLSIGAQSLFTLESSFQEKIHPRIKSVGFRLLVIYIGLTVAEAILLMIGKMNLFDSVCHSFGTVATGGFSPKNTSIADYSPYIQYVITAFMLLAGTNFLIHYYLIKRQFKNVKENDELKFFYIIIFVATVFITIVLLNKSNLSFENAFRDSLFQVTSIVTCTGFATADYLQWPVEAWVLIFFLMFLGGSIGSTSGGIKIIRHLVLFKSIKKIMAGLMSPNAIIPLRINGKTINQYKVNSILNFIIFYLLIFVFGSIVLVAMGLDIQTSVGSAATCMGGIGPGIGSVGPASNFAHLPDMAKIVLSALMILGRLELYTVLAIFTFSFWRN